MKALAHSHRLTLEKMVEILKFLPKIDLEEVKNILFKSLNPFQELKQKWLVRLLTDCLNSQEVNRNYIDWFASNISSKLASSILSKLFAAISKVEKLTDLELLRDFVAENKISSSDISLKGVSIFELKRSLEIKLLGNHIQTSINRDKLATTLGTLRDSGWSFEKLMEMFKKVDSNSASEKKAKEESLLQILESLVPYKIPATKNERILQILDCKVEEWIKKVNEVAIEINFQTNPQVRNQVGLVEKLKKHNKNNTLLQNFIQNSENLSQLVDQIKKTDLTDEIASAAPKIGSPISNLTKAEILAWAKEVKSDPESWTKSEFLKKALTVINRANYLHTGEYILTHAQILSCIVLLNAGSTKGRLLQVATGEGKSTIVSVIAIIHALQGKKVDIITSSPVLAERDAREKAGLYKMFDLRCMDNGDKSLYIKGPKNCYKQDIVYGEIAQFQFDTLRDEYGMLETLAGRKCGVAIIDEVDSMLIDDSSNIARLSSTIAGMDQFQTFIHLLWHRLRLLLQKLIVVNGENYMFYDQATQTSNLKESIKNMEDLNKVAFKIKEDIEIFLKQQLKKYLSKGLLEKKKIAVPSNFKEFVDKQIPNWVDNSLRAFVNQQDQQYVVQDGLIKPVAHDSTGVIRDATSWGDGLHQTIQRKHGLKTTSETCTTNFLSNIGYIKKCGRNVFGLTGTLGSKRAKEVLSEVYDVDLVTIPSSYKKRYLQLSTIIRKSQGEWLKEICDSALLEANKERGTLIICQTIEDCKLIRYELAKKYRSGAIKLYTMNNMNQEKDVEKINPGEIIVATNLAGRGTDIKTDDNVEKDGGLHVIVSFLPANQRVEDQAFGRTSRQGKCGTGQMILNRAVLLEYGDASSEKIKEMRDNFESKMFDEFMDKEYQMVKIKDELFKKFCNLKKQVCQQIKAQTSLLQNRPYLGCSVFETNMLNALEERWALFLHKIESDKIDDIMTRWGKVNEKYDSFEEQINKDLKSDELIQNPYYHIKIANDLLSYDSLSKSKAYFVSFLQDNNSRADYHLKKAIILDPQQNTVALVGKAWLAIKSQKKNDQNKSQFIKGFEDSLKPLHDEMAILNTLQTFVQQEHSNLDCDLSKQLNQKASILGSYINSIKHATTAIKRSQRLIDITGTKFLQKDANSTRNGDILKISSNFCGLERKKETKKFEPEILEKLGKYKRFVVTFNDLTMFSDSGDKDQAVETISEVFYSHNNTSDTKLANLIQLAKNKVKKSPALDPLVYKDLALTLEGLNTEELKILLDPDVQITDVSKDLALMELQKQFKNCFVDLEIIVDGKKQKSKANLKAQEAIEILKNSKDERERFNVLLKDVNETAKSLRKETENNFTLTLEYPNLSSEIAKKKIDSVKFDSLNLEISGDKAEILEPLKYYHIKTIQLISGDNGTETIEIEKAGERISRIKDQEEVWIKIEELTRETATQIITACKSASFQVTFIEVKPTFIPKDSEGESINVSFRELSPPVATNLIPILRKANLNFTLEFNNLKVRHLESVIAKASLAQEDIEITTVKKLSELFMEKIRPNLELSEFAARGIEYVLEINEKRFIPWRSISILAFIGALQLFAGALLMAPGLGFTYGMSLMTETFTEGIMIYKAHNNRHFR